MDFQYVAYNTERKLIKGRLAAVDEGKAIGQLTSVGVLNINCVECLMSVTADTTHSLCEV